MFVSKRRLCCKTRKSIALSDFFKLAFEIILLTERFLICTIKYAKNKLIIIVMLNNLDKMRPRMNQLIDFPTTIINMTKQNFVPRGAHVSFIAESGQS